MEKKTAWLPIDPVDSVTEIAKLILEEYYRVSHGHLPTQQKLNELIYLCTRDTFSVLGRPIVDAKFKIKDGFLMEISPEVPPIKALLNTEAIVSDYAISDVIRSVLPNYAMLESWYLREMIKGVCKRAIGTLKTNSTVDLTLENIWEDGIANPPIDYYTGEPLIPEENDE